MKRLKRLIKNIIFRYARDPLVVQFKIAWLFRNKNDLLHSCYPDEKKKGIIDIIDSVALKIEGDIAECGCYRGGGTILIAEIIKERGLNKHIYAFDTFEGMPKATEQDRMVNGHIHYSKGILGDTSLRLVQTKARYFKVDNIITFSKGYFQDTIPLIIGAEQKFSIIIIDPDQFEGTKCCLNFFYPKMAKGGIVLIDDYSIPEENLIDTPGVKLATDEFLSDKPEKIIHLAHSMFYFVKQ